MSLNKTFPSLFILAGNYMSMLFCTFQERLVSIMFGLLRQNKLNFVDVYREEAFTALKAIIKQVQASYVNLE